MDASSFFDEIKNQLKSELPFVVYKVPDSSVFKAWFQKSDELCQTTEFNEEGFVFAPFERGSAAVIFKKEQCIIKESDTDSSPPLEHKALREEVDLGFKNSYMKMIRDAIETIKSSELQKVVLSRAFQIDIVEGDPIEIFRRLSHKYVNAFSYCWYHPRVGMWLGATPELLFKLSRGQLSTVSLAGTLKANEGLIWTKKEHEEQQLVTDYITNQLTALATEVKTGKTEEVVAGKIKHLRTKITATLAKNTQDLKAIIKVLHPTPAVCGYPKNLAMNFIEDSEHYNRSYYTGFLGEINHVHHLERTPLRRNTEARAYRSVLRKTQLYVNLRCLKIEGAKGTVYVGGGIVDSSIPEKEWQETVDKSSTMLSII